MNNLTLTWDNLDPIESYSYVNNLNGTTYIHGYQKLEIKDGKTKITLQDGTPTTEVKEIAKARILSLEEVFKVAQKLNSNLTEENLRAFIERNLGTINTMMGLNLTKVDDAITLSSSFEGYSYLTYYPKFLQTYYTVLGLTSMFKIEPTYDLSLPEFMYQKLNSEEIPNNPPYAYWLLTPPNRSDNTEIAWAVDYTGIIDNSYGVYDPNGFGVRPVITIPKSKLAK